MSEDFPIDATDAQPRTRSADDGALRTCAALAAPLAAAGWMAGGAAVGLLLLFAWCGIAVMILRGLADHPHPRFGPGNALTALRAAATLWLGLAAVDPELLGQRGPRLAAGLGLVILALDGIDGALARRSRLTSQFGARFDVEVDAALTLALSAATWSTGAAGPSVLILALPYYAFSLARRVWPVLGQNLPPSRVRKLVCVVQIATPIVLLTIPLGAGVAGGLVWAVIALILASFARDLRYLCGRAR